MPDFIRIDENPFHKVVYSKVNYNEEQKLFEQLSSAKINLEELSKMNNLRRKIEWMTIRSALLSEHSPVDDIIYDHNRKPFFKKSSSHLSISHSQEMIAISIDQKGVTGIDIQYISDKVMKIRSKFLNGKELDVVANDPIELTYYWSIKEALFKVYGKKDAFLKENIAVVDIQLEKGGGYAQGTINCNDHSSKHTLKLKRLGDYALAYVVNS